MCCTLGSNWEPCVYKVHFVTTQTLPNVDIKWIPLKEEIVLDKFWCGTQQQQQQQPPTHNNIEQLNFVPFLGKYQREERSMQMHSCAENRS